MFCRKCGSQMPDDSIFCSKCGIKVEKINEKTEVITVDNQPAQKEFVCPTCGGCVTINNGVYVCHSGCGYKYDPNAQIADIETNITNTANKKQFDTDNMILSKKQIILILIVSVLAFITGSPAWFMDVLGVAIFMLAYNFGKQAKQEHKIGKLVMVVIITIIAFVLCSVVRGGIIADNKKSESTNRSFLSGLKLKQKRLDANELKQVDIKKEKRTEIYNLGDTYFYLLNNKTVKIDNDKYHVAVLDYPYKKHPYKIGVFEVNIKTNTMKMIGDADFTKDNVFQKAENISNLKEQNIPSNTPFSNVVAYLKSGNGDDRTPIISKSIIDLYGVRWGMSREETKSHISNLREIEAGKLEPFLSIMVNDWFIGGQKVESVIFNYDNNKLSDITIYINYGQRMSFEQQDYDENINFNRIIINSKKLASYLDSILGSSVKSELLDADNHKIQMKKGQKISSVTNKYYWWNANSAITLSAHKTLFSNSGVSHMCALNIKAK